jgi:chromosome segregation ATPase
MNSPLPCSPQRTVKLQASLDACQLELDACRADRNRLAELNETLIAEKQAKHSQLMRAHADIDSLTHQCSDARIECDKLRHQMDLAQSNIPAKELQVFITLRAVVGILAVLISLLCFMVCDCQILKLRDELDETHSKLNALNTDRLQLQAAVDVAQERHSELVAEVCFVNSNVCRLIHVLRTHLVTLTDAQNAAGN